MKIKTDLSARAKYFKLIAFARTYMYFRKFTNCFIHFNFTGNVLLRTKSVLLEDLDSDSAQFCLSSWFIHYLYFCIISSRKKSRFRKNSFNSVWNTYFRFPLLQRMVLNILDHSAAQTMCFNVYVLVLLSYWSNVCKI